MLQLIYRLRTQEKLLRDGWTDIEGSTRGPCGSKKWFCTVSLASICYRVTWKKCLHLSQNSFLKVPGKYSQSWVGESYSWVNLVSWSVVNIPQTPKRIILPWRTVGCLPLWEAYLHPFSGLRSHPKHLSNPVSKSEYKRPFWPVFDTLETDIILVP